MLVPALRRFGLMLGGIGLATAAVSTLLGLAVGASLPRSIAIGFYLVGCFFMLGGFFVGNRGPARVKKDDAARGTGWSVLMFFGGGGGRRLRWATKEEREETINMSAVLVALGFVLVVLGVVSDNRHSLF